MPDPAEPPGDDENVSSEPVDDDKLSIRKHWFTVEHSMNIIAATQIGLLVVVCGFLLHQMKPVLLPLVLALIVSLVLHPVYMIFRKLRLPRLLASLLTVGGLIAILGFGAYQAAVPGSEWTRTLDHDQIAERLQDVFRPVGEVRAEIEQVAEKVEKATKAKVTTKEPEEEAAEPEGTGEAAARDTAVEVETTLSSTRTVTFAEDGPAGVAEDLAAMEAADESEIQEVDEKPVVVEIREDPLAAVTQEAQAFGLATAAFLLLVLFILAYGNRIVRCLGQNETTEAILGRMGRDVSRYMFTITLINAGLGIAIGLTMWALGLPNPSLWGLMAFILNFIPYVGALIGTGVVFLVAAVEFESPGIVVMIPAVYWLLTAIEGNFVTPLVLGGRFRLNPLIVFVWIFAWAGFWGIAGMLIAMPALVIFKIVCETTSTMERFRRILAS